MTRVAEIDRAGMNVCFGQDSIKDPWYPLGNGNILRVLDAGQHICHMMGFEDLARSLDLVTDNSARTLNLGEGYGIEVGRPAAWWMCIATKPTTPTRVFLKCWPKRPGYAAWAAG